RQLVCRCVLSGRSSRVTEQLCADLVESGIVLEEQVRPEQRCGGDAIGSCWWDAPERRADPHRTVRCFAKTALADEVPTGIGRKVDKGLRGADRGAETRGGQLRAEQCTLGKVRVKEGGGILPDITGEPLLRPGVRLDGRVGSDPFVFERSGTQHLVALVEHRWGALAQRTDDTIDRADRRSRGCCQIALQDSMLLVVCEENREGDGETCAGEGRGCG